MYISPNYKMCVLFSKAHLGEEHYINKTIQDYEEMGIVCGMTKPPDLLEE